MSTIVLRGVKGTPLTNAEVDANFNNLNTDKLEAATVATLTNKTINLANNTLQATSAQLAAAVSDETGSGALVFGTSPSIAAPTITGALTLSGGTANGVAYLNASKVLTTGSALTFDGTNFATTGTTTATKLIPTGNVTAGNGMYLPTTNTLAFSTNGSERMRIESGGNLLVGGTTSTGKVASYINFGNSNNASFSATALGTAQGQLAGYSFFPTFQGTSDNTPRRAADIWSGFNAGAWGAEFLAFGVGNNSSSNDAGNVTSEKMRITSSGNVGIGTSSPIVITNQTSCTVNGTDAGRFDVRINGTHTAQFLATASAAELGSLTSVPIVFKTNGTERARIDASGTLILKGGTTDNQLQFWDTGGTVERARIGTSGTNLDILVGSTSTVAARITADGEVYIAGTTDQGAYNLQVNGTGVWGAGAYVNGSDARLKENVQTLTDGLSVITQLRPVTFQYKADYSKDTAVQPGFIAQELQQAMAGKDYVDGVVQAGPEYLNVAYQSLIPVLTKAIQELNAKVEALTAEIQTLKGN